MTQDETFETRRRLTRRFEQRASGGVLVAMSGGVDSCTLAAIAHEAIGEAVLAVTLDAESNADRELEDALAFAEERDLPHRVVEHSELADPAYRENTPARCYHCREGMMERLQAVAEEEDIEHVAMGYVPDDRLDHTPGRRAAREAGAWFPYLEAGVAKDEVREIAAELDLPVAERPSNACLSSRVPYGSDITAEKLSAVEQAEAAVRAIAGVEQVRVRHHDDVARIEVPPERRERVLDHAEPITARLKEIGFTFVSVDLLGYRTGAMNEALE